MLLIFRSQRLNVHRAMKTMYLMKGIDRETESQRKEG